MSSKGAGLIKTVFNTDNVVMRISEKVLDLVTVNLLFVLRSEERRVGKECRFRWWA